MKKKKETLKSLKQQLESLQIQFTTYKAFALNYVKNDSHRKQRLILSMNAQGDNGQLNAITIAELLAIVNMADQTKERIVLKFYGKTIEFYAETLTPFVPGELL